MSVERLHQSGGYVMQCDECRRQSEALRDSAEAATRAAEQLEWWVCPIDGAYSLCPVCQEQIISLAEGISCDRDDDSSLDLGHGRGG